MERPEAELIAAVLKGDAASFEPLIQKYSPRVFATARRYARRESEVEDIAQEVWFKAFQKLGSFRAEAPFEHWLMRLRAQADGMLPDPSPTALGRRRDSARWQHGAG